MMKHLMAGWTAFFSGWSGLSLTRLNLQPRSGRIAVSAQCGLGATRAASSRSPRGKGAALFAGVLVAAARLSANESYAVEDIPGPPGVTPECGGLSFLPDGRMAAIFDHGEVCIYDPATKTWRQFASGLHTPLGVLAVSPREILVCQRAELTRLVDTDGDGVADEYQCVCNAWGISGNYHEFLYGPIRDGAGHLFISIGSASAGGVARYEVRGPLKPEGYGFGKSAMFSVVPYRGWVAEIGDDGSLKPVAAGFRQPNGLVFDPRGRMFVTDNQGDWVGTSKLHYVVPGGFYGQPAGLVWRDDWKEIAQKLGRSPHTGDHALQQLDALRHEGAVLFPHAILANSPGQPVFAPADGKFGPFGGQMFVTEFNIGRVLRVMLEDVSGEPQGAVTTFYDRGGLRAGNIRLAFGPEGSLWVGQSERKLGWPAGEGIQRIRWNGNTPLDVLALHLAPRGFDFTFTKPVDPQSAGEAAVYAGKRYYYLYHADYGSPRVDIHTLRPTRVTVSPDGLSVHVELDGLLAGYIYEFNLKGLKGRDGAPIENPVIAYTANRLLDGSTRPVPRPAPSGDNQGSGQDKPTGEAG
jgi:hypothetical protein